ncbi:hypothetical protein Gpo141_00001044 [Globisporangium polare]
MNNMMFSVPGGALKKSAGKTIPPPPPAPERHASDSDASSDDERAVASSPPPPPRRRHSRQEPAHEDHHRRHQRRPVHADEDEREQQQRGRQTSGLSARPAALEQQLGAIELDMKKLERQRATLENLKLALDYGVVTQEEFVERGRRVMELDEAPKGAKSLVIFKYT